MYLSPGEPENQDFCYDWTVREINTPHIETNCNPIQGYTIEACNESALYLVRVYDKKNTNLPPRYYAFIVYIIESIDLIQVTNITECFDEDVELKFKVNLHGKGFSELQTSTKFLRIESKAKSPDSYISIFDTDYSPNQEIKVKVPQMEQDVKMSPSKDPKSYIFQNSIKFINDNSCSSNIIEITVYRLWIELFKHTGTDNSGNPVEQAPDNWMVVMNYDIECRVVPEHLIEKMTISLGSFWGPLQNGESNFPYLSNLRINEAFAPELSNLVFGDGPFSIVIATVTCKDGKVRVITSDKYEEYVESIGSPGQGTYEVIKRFMSPSKKAKIFFDKDEYPKVGEQLAPNWYKYWNQFCSEVTNGSEALNTAETYLQAPPSNYGVGECPKTGEVATNSIRYGELVRTCIYPSLIYDINYYDALRCTYIERNVENKQVTATARLNGVHGFHTCNFHEHLHAKVFQERWPNNYVDETNDIDHDAVPDDFEISIEGDNAGFRVGIVNSNFNFKTKKQDGNSNDIIYQHENLKIFNKSYEEGVSTSNNSNGINYLDWSYNPKKSFCQGKQWKKN